MKGRPAESLTGAAALGSLLAIVLGVKSPDVQACIITGLGLLPAFVTLVVANGGLRGVVRLLWRGRSPAGA